MRTKKGSRLSVKEIASLCGVDRNTIGYWIRSKKLYAERSGNKYLVPVDDLLLFLKTSGQKIPDSLADGRGQAAFFQTITPCWEYWNTRPINENCSACIAFQNKWEVCFLSKACQDVNCDRTCDNCQYYLDTYHPRIQFAFQFDLPAVVFKDLYVWGGNKQYTALTGMTAKDLIGTGLENLVHPQSLEIVISTEKRRVLGAPETPRSYDARLKSKNSAGVACRIAIYPLGEPRGCYCLLADPQNQPPP